MVNALLIKGQVKRISDFHRINYSHVTMYSENNTSKWGNIDVFVN